MSENTAAVQKTAMPKHGEFCWNELSVENIEASKEFYSAVFGWNPQKNEAAAMEYIEFNLGDDENFGGIWEISDECAQEIAGEVPVPRWMNYIAVDDVDESASKAFELGGTIVHPPMDIPNVGRFCTIKDPTGASISLITLKH